MGQWNVQQMVCITVLILFLKSSQKEYLVLCFAHRDGIIVGDGYSCFHLAQIAGNNVSAATHEEAFHEIQPPCLLYRVHIRLLE